MLVMLWIFGSHILMAQVLHFVLAADKDPKPSFAFSWLDDNNTFKAGDLATINIKLLGDFDTGGKLPFDKHALNFTITANGKIGNSSYISGVSSNFEGDPSTWSLSFTPIMVGVFNVLINDDGFGVLDSSLHFEVTPGFNFCLTLRINLLNSQYVSYNDW